MATITVNGNTVDPKAARLVAPDAKNTNFIYVQGYNDFTVPEKITLAGLGVNIQEYIAEFTYLCTYIPRDLTPVRKEPFVRTANVYHAELKSTVSLKDMVENDANLTEYEVDLIFHDQSPESSAELAPEIARAADVDINKLEITRGTIRLTVHQSKLKDLAAFDSINRIEEVQPKALYNDRARTILQAHTVLASTGYRGSGQTVCVADTGFDQGETAPDKVHPAFIGRVDHLVPVHPGSEDVRDPVGHGTHVCGSVCGNGTYEDQGTKLSVEGIAPAARLMVQAMSVFSRPLDKWILKSPGNLYENIFSRPYNLGIRIHNNSWGDNWNKKQGQLGYEADASAIDKFVTDHQDFVIVIAAGNDAIKDNAGKSQIGDNGAAKNCITVGATGTTRRNDGQRYSPNHPESPDYAGEDTTAETSSRGPTKSTTNAKGQAILGRIKPDIAAPGVAILSTASRSVPEGDVMRVKYGPSSDLNWLYMSGTSMATPLVAGGVALIREALQVQGKQKPSAALVKALLVNGAVNRSAPADGPGFDFLQGFGRVNLDNSIASVKQATFIDGGSGLETSRFDVPGLWADRGDAARHWISPAIPVSSSRNRLIAALAYSDESGALLQNDVNLIVRAGGVERHGNMAEGSDFDNTNNVERVIWNDVPGPTVNIIARASSFTKLNIEQSFAVAWNFQALTGS